jgi:zinc protease
MERGLGGEVVVSRYSILNTFVMNIPTLRTLPNGLTLAAYENPASPTEILSGLIPVGAMDEAEVQRGLAGMTASLLARGTAAQDYDSLNEAIEGVGAGVAFWSGIHNTGFSTKALREDFPDMVRLLGSMLRTPTFPADHLERIRAQRISGLREREQNPRAIADLLFTQTLYPAPHPYHYDPAGTIETITAIQQEEIATFHKAHYGSAGGYIVMVGAMPAEEALALAAEVFGDWAGGDAKIRTIPSVVASGTTIEQKIVGKQQSNLVYGVATIPRTHPDFMPLQLANMVLGVFGMMGRIGKVVRDEMGLAYTARSSLEGTKGQGAWTASAGVAPGKVAQAVAAIQAEWLRLGQELVSEEELNDCKTLLKGSLPLRLETNEGLARTWLDIIYYDLGLDYLDSYAHRIDAITANDILRVTNQYFDIEKAVLAVAGP